MGLLEGYLTGTFLIVRDSSVSGYGAGSALTALDLIGCHAPHQAQRDRQERHEIGEA